MSPSIIFLDECDHLGSNREAVDGEKSKELRSECFAAWSECVTRLVGQACWSKYCGDAKKVWQNKTADMTEMKRDKGQI